LPSRFAAGSLVRTYAAGKGGDGGGQEHPDTREWVFGLLATPRYRERMEQLETLELRRRSGCEPCLRSLVVDKWTPETLHHVGWCDSCRAATIALGMHAPAAAGATWFRRRAAWLAVAAFAVVAVPLVGSQVIDRGGSAIGVRGGSATAIQPATTSSPGTTTSTPTTTPSTPVIPVPRSKPPLAVAHARGHKALPLTT
jgi:hypothetical protein